MPPLTLDCWIAPTTNSPCDDTPSQVRKQIYIKRFSTGHSEMFAVHLRRFFSVHAEMYHPRGTLGTVASGCIRVSPSVYDRSTTEVLFRIVRSSIGMTTISILTNAACRGASCNHCHIYKRGGGGRVPLGRSSLSILIGNMQAGEPLLLAVTFYMRHNDYRVVRH